jgi:hypothetical protein
MASQSSTGTHSPYFRRALCVISHDLTCESGITCGTSIDLELSLESPPPLPFDLPHAHKNKKQQQQQQQQTNKQSNHVL